MALNFSNDVDLISVEVPGKPEVITVSVPGMQGPPGQFRVGNVTTGAPGTSAGITTATDAQGVQTVNFTIPRGDVGSSSSITIGTITTGTAGSNAAAAISGTAPNQTLNLTIPTGATGATGPAGTITSVTATALAAGATPTVTLGGTPTDRTIGFGIPVGANGATGSAGPANTLTIGTVTTGATGAPASATISGAAPNQVLNLTLPKGDQGAAGAGAPDATTTAKGSVQLAGDLAGTAAFPTVPALANKVDTSDGRLTNARTPTAHATSHATGGTDVLTPAAIGAAASSHTHTAANISDSTTVGRSVLTAVDAPTARTVIGAGTSNLAIGTTSTTAKAGDYQPTSANISDATVTGRSLLTALDAPTARTAIGAGTSSLVIGTTSTTAKAGDYAPPIDGAAGVGTMRTLGTTATSAAAGNHTHTPASIGAAATSHTHAIADLTATGTKDATTYLRGDGTWAVPAGGSGGTVTSANITDATTIGRTILTSADAATVRTNIGAGTSSLVIGTTSTTAKAGDYAPPSDGAAGVATMRTLGTGALQAAAGNDSRLSDARTPLAHTHTASQISDSTAVGRSLIAAVDAPTARTAIGAGTSSLVIGTTSSTAAAGDHTHTDLTNATAVSTASTLVKRDTSANANFNEVILAGQTTTASAARKDYVDAQVAAYRRTIRTSQAVATYTPTLADEGTLIEFSVASSVTLPSDAAVAFPVGSWIEFSAVTASAPVTVTPGASAVVRSTDGAYSTRGTYSKIRAHKTAANTWTMSGDTNNSIAQAITSASVGQTANSLVKRDSSGQIWGYNVFNQSTTQDASVNALTRKDYVDNAIAAITDIDTGWINLNMVSPFVSQTPGTVDAQVRRIGKLVKFRGAIASSSMTASTTHSPVANIPAAIPPPPTYNVFAALGSTTAASVPVGTINTSGGVGIRTAATLGTYYNLDNLSYFLD